MADHELFCSLKEPEGDMTTLPVTSSAVVDLLMGCVVLQGAGVSDRRAVSGHWQAPGPAGLHRRGWDG